MSGPPRPRWAVYWVPAADHPLWAAGCRWLGRDPAGGGGSDPGHGVSVATPARYGLHATLKPPMVLRPGVEPESFLADVAALAARHADFELPALRVAMLHDFLALRPLGPLPPDHPLQALADDCVTVLDPWRRPADEAERQRRSGAGLDARQAWLLARWGYPHVLDRWRFHLTLSDAFADPGGEVAAAACARARDWFAEALRRPLRAGALAVFEEPAPGAPFRLRHRYPLGPAA
jgi:hypothetical protein